MMTLTVLAALMLAVVSLAMEQVHHANGADLPQLGLGTAGLGSMTEEIVMQALDNGVRLIDTAQAMEWYDEEGVGLAVRQFASDHPEAQVLVVTKIHPRSYNLDAMRNALELSEHNFQGVGMRAVLLHAPHCWEGHCSADEVLPWQTAWKHLEDLKDEFSIMHIGVSNFDLPQLQELVGQLANRRVSVVQNWMDPLHQDADVRAFCSEHHIQYMAYSSFGTQWGQRVDLLRHPVLAGIADARGWTVPQVILAWLKAEGVVALPRSSNTEHLAINFAACHADRPCAAPMQLGSLDTDGESESSLSQEEVNTIRALDGSMGNPWD